VCCEYPVSNAKTRRRLNLRERPLAAMEGSALEYMGLSHEHARQAILALAESVCEKLDSCYDGAGSWVGIPLER
jgi:hypothetical protein